MAILLITAFVAGCISSDEDENTYNGEIHDLLITSDLLPEGWYQKDAIDYIVPPGQDLSDEQIERGFIEGDGADFKLSIQTEDHLTSMTLHQGVGRYDIEKINAAVDKNVAFLAEWYTVDESNEYEGGPTESTIDLVSAPAVGDYMKILKITLIYDRGPPNNIIDVDTQYVIFIVKKDILLTFQYYEAPDIESIDLSYILNLAKNLTSQM